MKKILFFALYIYSTISLSQPIINLEHFDKQPLQWGYYFGINTLDTKFNFKDLDYSGKNSPYTYDIQTTKSIGFNVGMTGDVRIIEYVNLRLEPALLYNKRQLEFPGVTEQRHKTRDYSLTMIYLPLIAKYSTKRWYNFKPYVTAGASMGINLSSNEKLTADNLELKFRTKRVNFFYEFGIGLDFYTLHFRFSPSIRGIFSMKNELIHDKDPNSPWTGNLKSIYTRGVMINLTFE